MKDVTKKLKYFIYILLCEDESYYIGISNDVEKRFLAHKNGKGAAYTRSHKPVKIIYTEECRDKSSALKREAQLKKLTKAEKKALIETSKFLAYSPLLQKQ